jgi:uncharacterized protein (DUF2141 family)
MRLPVIALACWIAVGGGRASNAEPAITIAGRVLNATDGHSVYVALWDAAGFLKQPVQQIQLRPGTERSFRFAVAPGRWAVSAFEDKNGNGVLDMGLFAPKEPSGFWRPFTAWRKPRFDDVALQVDRSVADAQVTLR